MAELLTCQTYAIVIGFVIDFFVGDPHSIPHPVVGIGRLISFLDNKLRIGNGDTRDVMRGVWTVLIVVVTSVAVPALILFIMWRINPVAYLVVSSIMCAQVIAARELVRECRAVEKALKKDDIEASRKAVSMVVGRDTQNLDKAGVCRAAVETVAENGSDGVVAPLFWMFLFGPVGGFFYKAVNTMDSMLGYKNDKYLYFGRAAAKTDDAVNYIPSRISALMAIACCPLCHLDTGNAWKIFCRDRYKHTSPNAAQTESVFAGALNVRLNGPAFYGGVLHDKEYLGDDNRPIMTDDIERSGHLMYTASFMALAIGTLIRTGVIMICF
ncbi:MAG: cobalamin biosynthesis protein CobD [Spirochaetia bacterium]|nr:cobalamin biosynthesis protein CobD [Spirochaetia bacterium]MBQ6904701.1 cobalamin biosynthesis protein CobD [Spirochaetia bacterium]